MERWGPSHQTGRGSQVSWKCVVWAVIAVGVLAIVQGGTHSPIRIAAGIVLFSTAGVLALPSSVQRRLLAPLRARQQPELVRDPLGAARAVASRHGGAVYLGVLSRGEFRFARAERALLLLGPPRSGKTSGVIIPAVLCHDGPVVSTSTRPDVWRATRRVRSADGRVWLFDPTGSGTPRGRDIGEELRWSPVLPSKSWDGALLIARAMTTNIGAGTTDRSHWANRAQALLAPMLHAAAVNGRDMESVVDWVMRHDLDEAGILLEDQRCSRLAFGNLLGLLHTEDRERSSIFSAAADALQAYSSEHALAAARDPNFDAAGFVRSAGTVYIHARAHRDHGWLMSPAARVTGRSSTVVFLLDGADNLPHLAGQALSAWSVCLLDVYVCWMSAGGVATRSEGRHDVGARQRPNTGEIQRGRASVSSSAGNGGVSSRLGTCVRRLRRCLTPRTVRATKRWTCDSSEWHPPRRTPTTRASDGRLCPAGGLKAIPVGFDQHSMTNPRLPVKAGPVPDKITIWPVDDGRYGLDAISRARRATSVPSIINRSCSGAEFPFHSGKSSVADGRCASDPSARSTWRPPSRRSGTDLALRLHPFPATESTGLRPTRNPGALTGRPGVAMGVGSTEFASPFVAKRSPGCRARDDSF